MLKSDVRNETVKMPSPLEEGQTVPPINRLNQGEVPPATVSLSARADLRQTNLFIDLHFKWMKFWLDFTIYKFVAFQNFLNYLNCWLINS